MKDKEDYKVIAREWRPRKFGDVVGQPHIVTTLKNSIRRDRIAHAYLFAGPRGVGKTTVARILAKAVNCAQGVREEPCDECEACKAINGSGFVDVIEIDAASNRGIDEIRELRETVRYLPMAGRRKVYIIDEAHMLTDPAFNALLKTLEEPPGHNIFILATTESHKIPYTIVSRCQRFDFRRISESAIMEQLRRICLSKGIECDERALHYIVREADGGLRDAESILDQVISYSGAQIAEKDVIDVIGVVRRDVAYAIVKSIVEKDPKEGLALIARTLEEGNDAYQVYKALLSFLRDMLMIKLWQGKPPFVFMDEEEHKRVAGLLRTVEYYEIQNMVHHMLRAEDLVRGVFPRASLEVLYVNLYNLSQLRDVEAMIDGRAGKGERTSDAPAGPQATRPDATQHHEPPAAGRRTYAPPPAQMRAADGSGAGRPPQAAVEADPTEAPDPEWPAHPTERPGVAGPPGDFVSYLREKSKMLFGMLASADMRVVDDRLVVAVDKQAAFLARDAAIAGELKKHASAFFGREMAVRFVDGDDAKADTIDDYMREAEAVFKTEE
jgi:DNA polymerase-3 subunit gamma/tau